ncbi:hypothetical protein FK529_16835 [Tsukamurella asaccharolytica]|uniref:Uncharacterized protein n=1 Tax=Tsukamurella asaccharolytica TaxID=2592067 RepID=A0A5C5R7A8_9ACTN|nr:hypothetical protein [Tsukamurella asaccharolytica]TWS18173.1 hypothetical protein FK529_16835 [Tsukamurella asaccharolytica]
MAIAGARVVLIAVLCSVVVLCGIGLWHVESRLLTTYPECVGTGSPRVSAVESPGEVRAVQSAIDRVLDGLGCKAVPLGGGRR